MMAASRSAETNADEGQVAQKLKDMAVRGYTMFPGLLSPSQTADGLAKVRTLHGAGQDYPHADGTIIANLQSKDPWFISMLELPLLEQVLIGALNDPYFGKIPPDQPNYILGEYIARSSAAKGLRLHIDSWLPSPGPKTWMVQAAYALEDRGIEDGCSVVVPGSHVSGTYTDRDSTNAVTDRDSANTVSVPLKKGDVVLWDSRLWHGAHPRTSQRMGWVLVATFQMWWVKPRFDIPKGLPREIYAQLTPKQKALMGYCSIPPADERKGSYKQGYDELE